MAIYYIWYSAHPYLAAINLFMEANSQVFKKSYKTLYLCTFLGTNGIQIVNAKWITDVVGIVPFKYIIYMERWIT
jgi:hypothetical protein